MRITLIGHASWLFEACGSCVLMDPVLADPHQEGLLDVHPRRTVDPARIPALDAVVVSHRHFDHFDIRSLATIARTVPVLIPRDPLIRHALNTLGFQRVVELDPDTPIKVGDVQLWTTPSAVDFPEFGLAIADGETVCWNAVDSVLTPASIAATKDRTGAVDVFLGPWQPMLEVDYQWNEPVQFPHARYRRHLDDIALVAPRSFVPAANGFRYRDPSAWLNDVVFPVTRERLFDDLGQLMGGAVPQMLSMDPGDQLDAAGTAARLRPGAAPFIARTGEGAYRHRFRPAQFDGRLRDRPLEDVTAAEVRRRAVGEIEEVLMPFLAKRAPEVLEQRAAAGVVEEIEVVAGDELLVWHIDHRERPRRVRSGPHGLSSVLTSITAESLYGLAVGRRSWDYVLMGGFHRRAYLSKSAAVLPDLLRTRFPSPPLRKAVVDREIEQWQGSAVTIRGRAGVASSPGDRTDQRDPRIALGGQPS